MSNAVCCDRCGKFEKQQIAKGELPLVPEEQQWHLLSESNYAIGRTKEWLLCPECSKVVLEVLGKPEVVFQ